MTPQFAQCRLRHPVGGDLGQGGDRDEEREGLRAEDQAIDHRRHGGDLGHHPPERAALQLAAVQRRDKGAERADRGRLGVGEDAHVEPAHHGEEQGADRAALPQLLADVGHARVKRLGARFRRQVHVQPHGGAVQRDAEQGRAERTHEQPADRRLGQQREHDQRARWRHQRAQRAARRAHARRQSAGNSRARASRARRPCRSARRWRSTTRSARRTRRSRPPWHRRGRRAAGRAPYAPGRRGRVAMPAVAAKLPIIRNSGSVPTWLLVRNPSASVAKAAERRVEPDDQRRADQARRAPSRRPAAPARA